MEVPIIISDEDNKSEISSRKKLKNRLTTGTFALLIALLAVVSATYAWYVYNTGRHTTKVRMAAGAGVNLQISNSYSGTYGSAAVLDSFSGSLNPVVFRKFSDLPMERKISPIWWPAFLAGAIIQTITRPACS